MQNRPYRIAISIVAAALLVKNNCKLPPIPIAAICKWLKFAYLGFRQYFALLGA